MDKKAQDMLDNGDSIACEFYRLGYEKALENVTKLAFSSFLDTPLRIDILCTLINQLREEKND